MKKLLAITAGLLLLLALIVPVRAQNATYYGKSATNLDVVQGLISDSLRTATDYADSNSIPDGGVSGADLTNPFRYLYKSYWSGRMVVGSQSEGNAVFAILTTAADTSKNVFGLKRGDTYLAVMDSSGKLGIGTGSPSSKLTINSGDIAFTTEGQYGLIWPGGSKLYEQTTAQGGTERMIYRPNGDRLDILNEAGSQFIASFTVSAAGIGVTSPLANSLTLGQSAAQRDLLITREQTAAGSDSSYKVTITTGNPIQHYNSSNGINTTFGVNTAGELAVSKSFKVTGDTLRVGSDTELVRKSTNTLATPDTMRIESGGALQLPDAFYDKPNVTTYTLVASDSLGSYGVAVDTTFSRTSLMQYMSVPSVTSPSKKAAHFATVMVPFVTHNDSLTGKMWFNGTAANADSGRILIVIKSDSGVHASTGWLTVAVTSTWEDWAIVIPSTTPLTKQKEYIINVYTEAVSGGRWCWTAPRLN